MDFAYILGMDQWAFGRRAEGFEREKLYER